MNQMFSFASKILLDFTALAKVVRESQRAFVLVDKLLAESSKLNDVLDILNQQSVSHRLYVDIKEELDIEAVLDGVEVVQEYKPDVLIAIGGTVAIDMSKVVYYFSKKQNFINKTIFIVMPTIDAVESAVSSATSVKDNVTAVKFLLVDELMVPDYVFLDLRLTNVVSPGVIARIGLTVMAHAVETLASKASTDFSDALAEKAIELLRSNSLESYCRTGDVQSKRTMCHAACLVGAAANNAGLGLSHSMAHVLAEKFHVAYGFANAILLPYIIQYNAGSITFTNKAVQNYRRVAKMIGISGNSDRISILNLIRGVRKINAELKIPASFKELGIVEEVFLEQLSVMAMLALDDRHIMTNPKTPNFMDVKTIYLRAYNGSGDVI